ncbi:MAG: carbohydrate kinase family protein [Chloroflexi bacterium]|jgi:adenosine kinase|nr:carbohydrate kinase family protein [Chloroflexota bacterium]
MKVVVTGSIAYDYLMSFPGRFAEVIMPDQLQNLSLSFLVDSMKRQPGGNAPNIAYTMALLGSHPLIMGAAGQDFTEYRAWLDKNGVDTSAIIEIEDDFTASFFVNTDLDLNQIASFYTGAMAHASKLTFAEYASDADLAIISPNDPQTMCAYTRECKELDIPYIYDPSQQTIRLTNEELYDGLNGCRLLTVNTYEYHLIQDRTGLGDQEISDRIGGLLVTRGAKGAELIIEGQQWQIPVVPAKEIVEPTGAGDAFRAGMMRGMELGLPWDVAGRMGALASTYVLEHVGTQNHHFTPAEFVARYRKHFDDQGALDVLCLPAPQN